MDSSNNTSSSHPAMRFVPRISSVVKWLIGINIAVYLLNPFFVIHQFQGSPYDVSAFDVYGTFSGITAVGGHEYWRFITYQFLHANFMHIAFNMFALWVFGPLVESFYGKSKFLIYYLSCGVIAALFYLFLGYLGVLSPQWYYMGMVGASGSIYGVIAACAVLAPDARVQLLFPPIELSIRQFALVVLAIACCFIYFEWNNAGGEAGHMGGMLAGFIITLVAKWRSKGAQDKWMFNPFPKKSDYPRRLSRNETVPKPSQAEVDAVLQKIAHEGLDSLSEKERAILKRAARQ